jgi:hypothetical protein
VKILKNKKELKNLGDEQLKFLNFETQEQILYENALRNVVSVIPNGKHYELNGRCSLCPGRRNPNPEMKRIIENEHQQCFISPMLGGSVISTKILIIWNQWFY